MTDDRKWLVVERNLKLRSADGDLQEEWDDAFVVIPATRAEAAETRVARLEEVKDEANREAEKLEHERNALEARVAELERERDRAFYLLQHDENLDRLHQATEALRECRDQAKFGRHIEKQGEPGAIQCLLKVEQVAESVLAALRDPSPSRLAGEDDGNTHETTHGSPDDL